MKSIAIALNLLLCVASAFPCTTFVLQDGGRIYFGRNLDWNWEDGWVIVNPRHVQKTALVTPGNTPAKWTAKYGSVTFNQIGREMPYGGMNEAGLVVENMWLDGTQYAAADARPTVSFLQWIQYQLDNCKTVAEVVATDKTLRVERPVFNAAVHYLVCDADGDCATIEFLNGVMVCHRGPSLPSRALANDTYDKSLDYARSHPETEGAADRLKDPQSLKRFTRAANRAAAFRARNPNEDVRYAFDTLEQVCAGNYTVWRMVYDVPSRRIHYRTRGNPETRAIDLKSLDFSCARPMKFVDIRTNPTPTGAFEFQELTEVGHRKYMEAFVGQDSVKQQFGDQTLLMEALLATLRGYSCADR